MTAGSALAGDVQFDISALFNSDVVCNNNAGVLDATQTGIDNSNFVFMTQATALQLNATTGNGLPDSPVFAANANHRGFTLGYSNTNDGNNVWRATGTASTLFTLPAPNAVRYKTIALAITSGAASANMNVIFTYSDASTSTVPVIVPDWFTDPVTAPFFYVLDSMDRCLNTATGYQDSNDPALYGINLTPDPNKNLTSIRFTRTGGGGNICLFAVTGTTVSEFVWDGGGANNNITTAQNWVGDVAPPNDGSADLVFTGATRTTPNVDVAFSTNSLTMSATANAFSFSGQALTLTSGVVVNNHATNALTFGNALAGARGFHKLGAGPLNINAVATYTGSTRFAGGTVTLGVNNALPAATTLFIGDQSAANFGNLVLNNVDLTVSSFTIESRSATHVNVTINTGRTLTVNGTGSFTIGVPGTTGATTNATFLGGGALVVNNAAGNLHVGLGNSDQNQPDNFTTLNITALSWLSANVGEFRVGFGSKIGTTFLMSNTANAITATTLRCFDSNLNNGTIGTMTLGTGTNTINADNVLIGFSKVGGTVGFASQAAGSPGTVVIAGKAAATANITVGSNTNTGTAAVFTATLDLRGHDSTVTCNTLTVGIMSQTGTGSTSGVIHFDTGTFTVNTVNMGSKANTGGGSANGTLNMGGGTFTVNTAFTLATQTGSGSGTGALNITAGTVNINADVVDAGGTTTTAITLNGGTLDMLVHAIGGATPINTLNFQSGTLRGISEINNGATPLDKTTAGVLTLDSANTHTGGTTVTAGTLRVMNTTGSAAGSGAFSSAAGTTVTGTGLITGTSTINGLVAPGDGGGGTLTLGGDTTFNSGASLQIQIDGTGTSDVLAVGGNVTLNANVALNVTAVNTVAGQELVVLNQQGAGAITGTFNGVAEGVEITVGSIPFLASYTRGDGNDFSLTDNRPRYNVNDASVNETAGTVTISVERLGNVALAGSVNATTVAGTATAGSDYTTTPATLNWLAGQGGVRTFTVPILNDTISEGTEAFSIQLSAPVNGVINDGTAAVSILDDEPLPIISIADFSVSENAGNAVLNIAFTGPASQNAVSVDVSTVDGAAVAGPDYTTTSITITWLAGDTAAKTVIIPLVDDLLLESDESFSALLSNLSTSAALGNGTAAVTILDDDVAPVAVADSASTGFERPGTIAVLANDQGLSNAPLTVVILALPANGTVVVNADNTVTYTGAAGFTGPDSFVYQVTDAVGQSASATVSIAVRPPPQILSGPTITPNPCVVGQVVTAFAASDTGAILWNWGDGSTGAGTGATHAYSSPGSYTLVLTALSAEGIATTSSVNVFVGLSLTGTSGDGGGGGATPPGVTGILVGGAGAGAAQGGSGKISCNYVRREKTYYQGSIASLNLPDTLKQDMLLNMPGTLTIGTGTAMGTFRFSLDKRGRGKSTGLPQIEFNVAKKRFRFKAQRADLTDLTEALGGPQQFGVKKGEQVTMLVPVTVQIGNDVFLALTFQVKYQQISTSGKGGL